MEKQVPNQHLADRIAGKVDIYGNSLVKKVVEEKKEENPVAKVEKPVAKGKKK
jgi:hypothetical protein